MVEFVFKEPKHGRQVAAGFYPFINVSNVDLSRYGIYKEDQIERATEPCLITAFRSSGIMSSEEMNQLTEMVNTRVFPQIYLRNIAEHFKINIYVRKYHDYGKSSHVEYKTEGARFEEMNAQIEDLKTAEEDAIKIIKELSAEMLEKFNAEFVKIQENFTKVFKELFGGGNARLELLPSEDPLTRGVEIIAQPPGKVLQNITLMSGGEKTMTAIAILFAILKLKPMPFCFLDEIEAALDDANIDRYANYLKRFSQDTQFIVITHRKPTMEVVDSLYGVTMEEKGVSKIVSVKLADAVKVVEGE